jgi:endonuclease/exonuclease/phosphatase family metal-dependent hydrolase
MRKIITRRVPTFTLPSLEERERANVGPSTREEHDRWMAAWPALTALECAQPSASAVAPDARIRVAAWNLERCKHVEASAAVLAERGIDVILATEMDHGCARSGQRHTTADLAAELGLGFVFGVEFVELALGDAFESLTHAGDTNRHGLHGNAVLSRFPILDAALIPLDEGGQWYVSDLKQGQRRIGGRNAIAALLDGPQGSFWAVSIHFESESTPDGRAAATRRLLEGLATLSPAAPTVLGGDFNVFELSRKGLSDEAMFAAPESVEPAFGVLADAGYAWRTANAPGVTTRLHPRDPRDKPLLRIDWLFNRGLAASDPWIAPALAPDGLVLSDHDVIGAAFGFEVGL